MSENVVQFDRPEQSQYERDYLAAAAGSTGIKRVREIGLSQWQIPEGARLLDAGCGNGEVARELAARPGTEVVGVDFSADAIAQAVREDNGAGVTYEIGDLTDLPYENGYFDGVRTERVIQHLADPERAVAELTRVLRPGGRMCLIDTDFTSLVLDGSPAMINERAKAVLDLLNANRPAHAVSSGRTLRRRMIQAGLTDVRAEPVTIAFTDVAEASQVVPLERDSPMLAAAGPIVGDLLADVEQAAADGTFLLALTMWVAVGSRAR